MEHLLQICKNCNESKLNEEKGRFTVLGDPTEGALLTLAEKYKLAHHQGSKLSFRRDEIFPFDSDRKMMSVVVHDAVNKRMKVLVKGSPDQVLQKCTHWSDGKTLFKLDAKNEKNPVAL